MMHFPEPDPERARLYRDAGYWRGDTIIALCRQAGRLTPDKIAVLDASGMRQSYEDIDDRSERLAGFLAGRGVGKGDIVTVCLPNWWQTVVVFLAVMKVGAVVNPVPTTYGRADLAFVLAKCRSAALFVPGRFRNTDFTDMLAAFEPQLKDQIVVVRVGEGSREIGTPFDAALAHQPLAAQPAIGADDPVAVLFTSGTESRPKGAVHTHNTILFGERSFAEVLGIDTRDIAFMPSPISHTTGFMHGVVMTLITGGTLSLLDIFDGATAVAQMRSHRCTWTMGATPFLGDVTAPLDAAEQRLPDLRYFLCGGAPIPEALVKRAAGVGLRVLSIYGSTESPPHTVVYPHDPAENSWKTDGRPLGGIDIRIVSEQGVDLPVGEVGEEWSRGPNTFLGYLDEQDLSCRYLDSDGWYHSGDLARLLADGSIRVTGRLKDIIVRGGQNISVREVEDYLTSHPAVHSAAVVGIPHPRLGETGCAVVVTKAGHDLALSEITEFLLQKGVARFKLPERLEIWPSLPTTPSGKVQKFAIRQMLNQTLQQKQT